MMRIDVSVPWTDACFNRRIDELTFILSAATMVAIGKVDRASRTQ